MVCPRCHPAVPGNPSRPAPVHLLARHGRLPVQRLKTTKSRCCAVVELNTLVGLPPPGADPRIQTLRVLFRRTKAFRRGRNRPVLQAEIPIVGADPAAFTPASGEPGRSRPPLGSVPTDASLLQGRYRRAHGRLARCHDDGGHVARRRYPRLRAAWVSWAKSRSVRMLSTWGLRIEDQPAAGRPVGSDAPGRGYAPPPRLGCALAAGLRLSRSTCEGCSSTACRTTALGCASTSRPIQTSRPPCPPRYHVAEGKTARSLALDTLQAEIASAVDKFRPHARPPTCTQPSGGGSLPAFRVGDDAQLRRPAAVRWSYVPLPARCYAPPPLHGLRMLRAPPPSQFLFQSQEHPAPFPAGLVQPRLTVAAPSLCSGPTPRGFDLAVHASV